MALSEKQKKNLLIGGVVLGAGGLLAWKFWPKPKCTSDSECQQGQVCVSGKCESIPPSSCTLDSDCPSGYVCVGGICKPVGPTCSIDSDCPTGYTCINGNCIQLTDPCVGANCPNVCNGYDKWSQKCVNIQGSAVCVDNALIQANDPICVPPPPPQCSATNPCPDKCSGQDMYSQNCQNGVCVLGSIVQQCSSQCGCTPSPPLAASVTALTAAKNSGYLDIFDISSTIKNGGPAWQFFALLKVTAPNGSIYTMNMVSTGTLQTNQTWNYPSVSYQGTQSGNYTINMILYKESQGATVVAQKTITFNFIPTPPTINSTISQPIINHVNAVIGDVMYLSADITNTGNAPYDFKVGCSITSPNGTRTDSSQFDPAYGDQTYKSVYLEANQTKRITFYETLGVQTGIGTHTVLMAVYKTYPFVWANRLDDSSGVFHVTATITADITSISTSPTTLWYPGQIYSVLATIKNTGNANYDFWIGCSLFKPNGIRVDSINFNPSQPYILINLDPGKSRQIEFTNIVATELLSPGTWRAAVAVWDGYDPSGPAMIPPEYDWAEKTFNVTT